MLEIERKYSFIKSVFVTSHLNALDRELFTSYIKRYSDTDAL
jgi:hypothetical protein